MVLYALVLANSLCSANVSFGSKNGHKILGKKFVTRMLLAMLRLRDLEYSAGSGVKRVAFFGLRLV